MRFKHVKPNIYYKQRAFDFVNEFRKCNSIIHGGGRISRYLNDSSYEEWLDYIDERSKVIFDGKNVPDETYFFVDEEDNIIGIINIRLGLNDMLRDLGGHIGFSIRPSKRGNGYNKINLFLGLKRLNEVGVKEALLDCEKDNKASSGTMKALGGKLVNTKIDEVFGVVEDYIIDVDYALTKFSDLYEPFLLDNNYIK